MNSHEIEQNVKRIMEKYGYYLSYPNNYRDWVFELIHTTEFSIYADN